MPHPPAPSIPGLSFVGRLGAGGYADVYLYQQALPARRVAVKVLRDNGLGRGVAQRFRSEANAMARLEHPHILPVYATGSAADGRPYLVMMHYPRASLAERVRTERLGVPEAVRIGIQLASAVETAHRANLLHRDIKPANVLTSQYGTPGLTDFGIAAEVSAADDADTGVSVPWSPPEVLYATAAASPRSDVYSPAATLWHLLVGVVAVRAARRRQVPLRADEAHPRPAVPPTGRLDVHQRSAVHPDAGGWAEVLDAARDAGRPVPQRATRLEQSALLERVDVHDLARRADAAVFGAGGVADARVADYWASVHGVRSALLSELPWWRRWAARLSLASLLARRPGSAARTAPPVGAAQ